MDFIISAKTDIGIAKETNQDSLSIKRINTNQGRMVFAILCDGMGGLAKGEVASASVVSSFHQWVINDLPLLCNSAIEDYVVREQWEKILMEQNHAIKLYGTQRGIQLGTTAVIMLLTQNRYYIMNVGDSRAYEIKHTLKQITIDQTFIAREIARGTMTVEQARHDERRNVLLQSIGVSDQVYPEMFCGELQKDAVYMLCSDGFRHEITEQEIFNGFCPDILCDEDMMNRNTLQLIDLNKQRAEKDNISVALVRTF